MEYNKTLFVVDPMALPQSGGARQIMIRVSSVNPKIVEMGAIFKVIDEALNSDGECVNVDTSNVGKFSMMAPAVLAENVSLSGRQAAVDRAFPGWGVELVEGGSIDFPGDGCYRGRVRSGTQPEPKCTAFARGSGPQNPSTDRRTLQS